MPCLTRSPLPLSVPPKVVLVLSPPVVSVALPSWSSPPAVPPPDSEPMVWLKPFRSSVAPAVLASRDRRGGIQQVRRAEAQRAGCDGGGAREGAGACERQRACARLDQAAAAAERAAGGEVQTRIDDLDAAARRADVQVARGTGERGARHLQAPAVQRHIAGGRAEVHIGGNGQRPALHRGAAGVGIGAAENQRAVAGLGDAGRARDRVVQRGGEAGRARAAVADADLRLRAAPRPAASARRRSACSRCSRTAGRWPAPRRRCCPPSRCPARR